MANRKIAERCLFALVAFLCLSAAASTANRANVTPRELASALAQADPQAGKISPTDIRRIRCVGPIEEPTEFKCTWLQRTETGWVKKSTWLAIDGSGWHVID